MLSFSRNEGSFTCSGSTAAACAGVGFFAADGFFDLDFPMLNPLDDFENHSTTTTGLNEFMRAWIAYCAMICLVPGVLVLGICVAFGSLFALIISPFHAAVYLGAAMEGTRRLLKACALGVLSNGEEKKGLQP